ncbi:MAG: hypothetical protein KGV50_00290 [Gammaproteobacteria bacterium]|nr:hypothetical protein [Gammaproteobacteria bacterium]
MIELCIAITCAVIAIIGYLLMVNKRLKNGLRVANERIKRQERVITNARISQKNNDYVQRLNVDELDNSLHEYYRD